MKVSGLVFAVAVAIAALTGCSSGDGEIAVEAASSPLSAEANDKLFTVKIVEAREGGYALDKLVVKAIVDGKDPIIVSCTTQDLNTSKTLDKDDKLDCAEGAENKFDTAIAGQEVDVELYATIDGKEELVGSSTWTVASAK